MSRKSVEARFRKEMSVDVIPADKLLQLLPFKYHIEQITHLRDLEPGEPYDDFKPEIGHVITSVPDGYIKEIKTSHCFWTSTNIFYKDGTKVNLHSSNLRTDDKEDINDEEYRPVSPLINYDGKYIRPTETLYRWLENLGVSIKAINEIKTQVYCDRVYYYPGVACPVKSSLDSDQWAYGTKYLTIKASEIAQVLHDIRDEELAMKVYKVLTTPPDPLNPNIFR